MLKRKHMIVAAAALAAAPLAAQAAVITFAYDPTVTYSSGTAFTTATGTASILNGQVTVPSGDFFRFNVNVLVTGVSNAASGGSWDTANGTTQPTSLGLTGWGLVISDSAAANDVPRVVSNNAVVNHLTPGGAASPTYDISGKGATSAASGQVGTTAAPLSGALNPGLDTTGTANGYYRLTLGAGSAQDIFSGLTYQALTSSKAVLTPATTAGSVAYAVLASAGSSGTAPSYVSHPATGADTINNLPALTINPGATTGASGHSIISLTAASGGAPSGYGSNVGTVTVTGSAGSYKPSTGDPTTGLTGTTTDYVEGKTFTPSTDKEIYALEVTNGSNPATDVATIVSDINNGVGSSIPASTGVVASTTLPAGAVFPGGPYNLYLTFASPPSGDNFMGWDFSNTANQSTSGIATGDFVSAVALVPEPASTAFILVGASGALLGRRRRNKALQGA